MLQSTNEKEGTIERQQLVSKKFYEIQARDFKERTKYKHRDCLKMRILLKYEGYWNSALNEKLIAKPSR